MKQAMKQPPQINLWFVLIAVMGIVFIRDLWVQSQTITAIPYSQFETYLDDGKIDEVLIGSTTISGTFKEPQDGKTGFVTTSVPPAVAARLDGHDITFSGAIENTWFTTLLSWVLPALFFVGIWMFAMRRMGGGQGMGCLLYTSPSPRD